MEQLEDRDVPATFTVTNLADAGAGSLRDAITQANASSGVPDDIVFATGLTGTIALQSVLPTLTDAVTITGPGAPALSLTRSASAITTFGFFNVQSGVTASITDLTLTGANSTAVLNFGTLTLDQVVIQNNTVTTNSGNFIFGNPAGIGNTGTLTVQNSTIANNSNTGTSGLVAAGIDSEGGSVAIDSSTISGNISNNTNSAGGVGIYGGTAVISNTTITLNQSIATSSGGGIDAFGTTVFIVNTVVAGNIGGTNTDTQGTFVSGGGNFIGINATATGFGGGDQVGSLSLPLNALLGPLTNNGGPTPTHLPLVGSPLIDAGNISGLSNPTDQRGFSPRVFNGIIDIGAVEVGATGPETTPPTLSSIVDGVGGGPVTVGAVVTYTVTFSEDIDSATVTVADFSNAGTAGIAILSVTETGPSTGVFTVVVATNLPGTLRLQVNAGAVIRDLAGNNLITASAILDDTTIAVNNPPIILPPAVSRRMPYGNPGISQRLLDPQTQVPRTLTDAFPGYRGDVAITLGEFNGDGILDVVALAVASPGGHVKVLDGQTGAEFLSFMAFPGFQGAISIATGDVNGDGHADIITGGAGHVKVFDGQNGAELLSFMAFSGFRSDINVAAGDITGDGHADIVVGTGTGVVGGHVKVFDAQTQAELLSFMAYPGFSGGVNVAAGDLDGDGRAEIITGTVTGPPHVRSFTSTGAPRDSFLAPNVTGDIGVFVLAVDSDGDGDDDIITMARDVTGPFGIFGWTGTPI